MNKHRFSASMAQPIVFFGLHHFPRNSPQAAARIVALALISNGEINLREQAAVLDYQVPRQLGLTTAEWRDVLGMLRDEVGSSSSGTGTRMVDPETLARWLDEVDDPALRSLVLRLSTLLIGADGFIDPGESSLLGAALRRWHLPEDERSRLEPMVYGLDFQVAPR